MSRSNSDHFLTASTESGPSGLDLVTNVPPAWHQSALLTQIGKPALPFPNVEDHAIERVIEALVVAQPVPA